MTNKKLKISLDDILQGFIDETEKMVDELKQEKDREINELRIEKDKEINKIDTKEEVDVDSHSNKDSEELFSIKEDCIDLNSKDCEDSEYIIDSITLDSRSDTEEFIYESDGKGRYGKYIRKVYNKFIILKSIKGEDVKFGSFDSHEEALKARDKLIEDNWGFPKDEDVNLNREGQYGKYIVNLNGVFKIAKLVDGSIRSFGYYKDLETAQRVRDLLVDNNWEKFNEGENELPMDVDNSPEFLAGAKENQQNFSIFLSFKNLILSFTFIMSSVKFM